MYQYLPTEFGEHFANEAGHYDGYDRFTDGSTSIVFSSVAFRYGHSSFRNYQPLDQCGVPTMFNQPAGDTFLLFGGQTGGPITPMDTVGEAGSYENAIRGLLGKNTAPVDVMMDDSLRNIPFLAPVAGGTDLLALDMHRAKENGVPNYVKLQETYGRNADRIYGRGGCHASFETAPGPDPIQCWTNLVSYNASLAATMRSLYGKVNTLDPIIGMLAESKVGGTSFGETLGSVVADNYRRKRAGDRFWFENQDDSNPMPFNDEELENIRAVGMDDLLRKNFNFPSPAHVPANPFLVPPHYLRTLSHSSGCSS